MDRRWASIYFKNTKGEVKLDKYEEQRLNKLEIRQDKLEDKVNMILQEISSFKPILNEINKNIEKLSENSIERERVIKLEDKVNDLEKELQEETISKKAKFLEELYKYVIITLLGLAIGFISSNILK